MKTGEIVIPEQIAELKKRPIDYSDIPKLTPEQLARFKPVHPELFKTVPVKMPISIKLDADILAWLKAGGKGYQTRINAILRQAMMAEV